MTSFLGLEGAEEVDDVLLVLGGEAVEALDDAIGFAARAPVVVDGFNEVGGASVVEEEDALADSPERRGTEFVGAGAALGDAVGETFAHVMHEQIGEEIDGLTGERGAGRF